VIRTESVLSDSEPDLTVYPLLRKAPLARGSLLRADPLEENRRLRSLNLLATARGTDDGQQLPVPSCDDLPIDLAVDRDSYPIRVLTLGICRVTAASCSDPHLEEECVDTLLPSCAPSSSSAKRRA
jgi:hypothetical protein